MSATPTVCPVCDRPTRVNLDGQLRKHKARLATMDLIGRWCPNRSPNAKPPDRS